ncbi:MFS transporter [Nakamurella endophytica]
MLSTSLVALDSTIIATAVPSVVASLGGLSQFPWLFSVYLLAQAISVPIYGRVADMVGRKPVMLLGIGLFLLGSVLCGIAWDMPALIVFRAVQGLGAGAVQPMSITIAGDIYTLQERAKAQGYLASVWGISAVVGPTLGGLFSEYVSWRWIFWVNVPLCLVAGLMLVRRFHEQVHRARHRMDLPGSALLAVGCGLLILGLLEGGQAWAWGSVAGIGVLGVAVLLLVAFVLVERRTAEPVLPLWVLTRRVLAATSVTAVMVGGMTLGLTSYVPTYAQSALAVGPLAAGFALATLTVGWPLAASVAGRLYLRIGFRDTALIGAALALAGTLSMAVTMTGGGSVWEIAAWCFVTGLGLGLVASPTLIAAQSSVGWDRRGVVTGANMFARSLGSAVGVAVLGAVANTRLGDGTPAPADLAAAAHDVFVGVVVVAVLMVAAVALLPRRIVLDDAATAPRTGGAVPSQPAASTGSGSGGTAGH